MKKLIRFVWNTIFTNTKITMLKAAYQTGLYTYIKSNCTLLSDYAPNVQIETTDSMKISIKYGSGFISEIYSSDQNGVISIRSSISVNGMDCDVLDGILNELRLERSFFKKVYQSYLEGKVWNY